MHTVIETNSVHRFASLFDEFYDAWYSRGAENQMDMLSYTSDAQ